MIKAVSTDTSITREVKRTENQKEVTDTFVRTDFLADEATDITAMNAEGSGYLKYPSGSMVYCIENGNKYILKGDCSEYVVESEGCLSSNMIVNITTEDDEYKADKGFSEIKETIVDKKKDVILVFGGSVYRFAEYDGIFDTLVFSNTVTHEDGISFESFFVSEDEIALVSKSITP